MNIPKIAKTIAIGAAGYILMTYKSENTSEELSMRQVYRPSTYVSERCNTGNRKVDFTHAIGYGALAGAVVGGLAVIVGQRKQ